MQYQLISTKQFEAIRDFFAELTPELRTIFSYICDEDLSEDESLELKTLLEFTSTSEERTSLTDE